MPRFGLDLLNSSDDDSDGQEQDSFDPEQSVLASKAARLHPKRASSLKVASKGGYKQSQHSDSSTDEEDAEEGSSNESGSNSESQDSESDVDMPPVSRLSGDEESDEEEDEEPARKQQKARKSVSNASSHSDDNDDAASSHLAKESSPSVEDDAVMEQLQNTRSPFARRNVLALQLHQDPARNKVMQASMFPQNQQPSRKRLDLVGFRRDEVDDSEEVSRKLIRHKENTPPVKEMMPARKQRTARPFAKVPAEKSLLQGLDGHYKDPTLALGRSFRPGFGPGGVLAFQGDISNVRQQTCVFSHSTHFTHSTRTETYLNRPQTIHLKRNRMTDGQKTRAREAALHSLQIQRQHSELAMFDVDSVVAWTTNSLRFHHFSAVHQDAQSTFENSLYQLGHALYDELDVELSAELSTAQSQSITNYARRLALSKWLEDACSAYTESDLGRIRNSLGPNQQEKAANQSIFALLTGHQIERAVEQAIDSGNLHLATLIAQAGAQNGANDQFRADIFLQLKKWRENRADAHVDPDLRKIYELLCGNVTKSDGYKMDDPVDGARDLLVCKNLEWVRAFGVYLWYGQHQASVADVTTRYDRSSRQKQEESPVVPLPWYEAQDIKRAWKTASNIDERSMDARFQLLQLAANQSSGLESVLLPRSTDSSPIDARISWHLYQTLAKSLAVADFDDRAPIPDDDHEPTKYRSATADRLTCDYAAQLEQLDLWEWSAFVLLHLTYVEAREKAIRDLLSRNIHRMTTEGEQLLLTTICLPDVWIAEAKGERRKLLGNFTEAFDHFVAAQLYTTAHKIAVWELAPQIVLSGDFVQLRTLFEPLLPYEMEIADWHNGAQIYLDYASCIDTLPRLLRDAEDNSELIHQLAEVCLPRLLQLLPQFLATLDIPRNLTRAATVEQMLSDCMDVRLAFCKTKPTEAEIPLATLGNSDRLAYIATTAANMLDQSLATADHPN